MTELVPTRTVPDVVKTKDKFYLIFKNKSYKLVTILILMKKKVGIHTKTWKKRWRLIKTLLNHYPNISQKTQKNNSRDQPRTTRQPNKRRGQNQTTLCKFCPTPVSLPSTYKESPMYYVGVKEFDRWSISIQKPKVWYLSQRVNDDCIRLTVE